MHAIKKACHPPKTTFYIINPEVKNDSGFGIKIYMSAKKILINENFRNNLLLQFSLRNMNG